MRSSRASDLDAYAAMQADPEVIRRLVTGGTFTPVEVFIGRAGVFEPLDWPEPELAYSLDQPFWRNGFASKASDRLRVAPIPGEHVV
jgi:hypothetical protein